MPKGFVNLDALIPRQDFVFSAIERPTSSKVNDISAELLKVDGHLLHSLLKPDFQRETAFWSPQKVRDLILAFVNDELVPSVIIWRSPPGKLFVIDGAHRLSCLIAWVNDDYGDNQLSRDFLDHTIVDAHAAAADEARTLVNSAVGPYAEIVEVFKKKPEERNPRYVEIATNLNSLSMRVQSFDGPPERAEQAFFKINEQGVRLSKTELTLLKSRKCPNAVAARAISQRGSNNFYWKEFAPLKRKTIEKKSLQIHDLMFDPPLLGSVLKTSDVPIAGKGKKGEALPLIFEIVNMANGHKYVKVPRSPKQALVAVPEDPDGLSTITHLARTKAIIDRINSNDPSSLGLHPLIYFYSDGGRHLPSSFLAIFDLMVGINEEDGYKQFTAVRAEFEDFLIDHRAYIPQLQRKARGELKAVRLIKKYFEFCLKSFKDRRNAKEIVTLLKDSADFSFLSDSAYISTEYGADFSSDSKNQATIERELRSAERCTRCLARINGPDISYDHVIDKKHGGDGRPSNKEPNHHYCNSAKDQLVPYLKKEARHRHG